MVLGVLACINYGSAAILCSEGFSSKETLKACSAYQCTSLYGVPRMFQEVLKEYEKD
jgi:fatty-acyl-CoA synthase